MSKAPDPRLDGIGWSFAPSYGGAPIADQEEQLHGDAPRRYADRASHYFALDHRFTVTCSWEYCADCGFALERHWLGLFEAGQVLAIGPTWTVDATRAFDAEALALLSSGLARVPASEPEYRLRQAGLGRRELLVAGATFQVLGRLAVADDMVAGQILRRIKGEDRADRPEGADRVLSVAPPAEPGNQPSLRSSSESRRSVVPLLGH